MKNHPSSPRLRRTSPSRRKKTTARPISLVFGTGNPEDKYMATHHNLGHLMVTTLATEFTDLLKSRIGKFGRNRFAGLPLVFMNQSGEAVRELQKKLKLRPEEILVVHDDADIPFSSVKLQFETDDAGHRGVRSIMKALGTKKFWRLRIGIQPIRKVKHVDAMGLVLKKFSPEEEKVVKKMRKKFPELIELILARGPEKASIPRNFFSL